MQRISQSGLRQRLRIFGGTLFLAVLHSSVALGITFGWDPNPEPNIVDYRIHYGVASGAYTQVLSAGTATTATVTGLTPGTTYYFALSAVNSLGLESSYTGEIVYTVPVTAAALYIRIAPNRQALLTVIGQTGLTYDVQATTDLRTWTNIGSVTIGASGSTTFTDTTATNFSKRFYRSHAR